MDKVGDSFEREITFSQEDVITFARITGDNNPIHLDKDFASNTKYGGIIVHGNFAASSILIKSYYRGVTILIHKEMTFIRPVFVNEIYKIHIKLIAIDFDSNIATYRGMLKNKDGKICIHSKSKLKNTEVFVKEPKQENN